nr:unnamed protein product [Digitaria exilis]
MAVQKLDTIIGPVGLLRLAKREGEAEQPRKNPTRGGTHLAKKYHPPRPQIAAPPSHRRDGDRYETDARTAKRVSQPLLLPTPGKMWKAGGCLRGFATAELNFVCLFLLFAKL